MCYTLAVALLLFICQQNGIPGLPYLALEYHCPRMLHAALTDSVLAYHWGHLIAAAILGTFWAGLAALLFRRYGCNPSTNPFWLRNRLASLGMVRLQALLSWTACFLFLSARAIRLIGRT